MSQAVINYSVLTDVNDSNSSEITEDLLRMALIENPCNTNEILTFGGDKSHDINVFNRSTNKSKQNKIGLYHSSGYAFVACYVVEGNTPDTLLILWGNLNVHDMSSYESYYGIFNCRKMQFDHAIKNDWGIYASQTVHKINNLNLLFRITIKEIIIYDVSNENSPKKMNTSIKIPKEYTHYHGSIMLVERDIVHFVVFGSQYTPIYQSFYHIKLNLKTFQVDDKFISPHNDKGHEWSTTTDIAKKIDLHELLSKFSYHWYKSRYLIIVGGYGYGAASDQIKCFDVKQKIWYTYKLPSSLHSHKSILIHENNDLYLYVFGGKKSLVPKSDPGSPKLRWKLRMTQQLDWKIERLIWIGYHENKKDEDNCNDITQENTKECPFSQIPKDVVGCILSFIRRKFLFE